MLLHMLSNLVATEGALTLDTSLISTLLEVCKQTMGLFTEFPLNFILIGSFVGMGFGIFRMAKRSARS